MRETKELLPKSRSKDLIPVRHNYRRQTMEFEDIGDISHSHFVSSERMSQRKEMRIPGQFVYHDQHAIEASRARKTLYKVHSDRVPDMRRYLKGFQKARVSNAFWLGLLADGTTCDELADMILEPWPCKQGAHSSIHHIEARVPSKSAGVQG
jgi:hypothetical protein